MSNANTKAGASSETVQGGWADAIRRGDSVAVAQIAATLIKPRADNLVFRPWGGYRLKDYKGLSDTSAVGKGPWGEAFELCAFDDDPEASRHPSVVPLPDGSTIALPELLRAAGEHVLGDAFVATHGRQLPLLPKTLHVCDLLSVQAHPEGNTEAYIIIDAEPGATLCLGWCRDVDEAELSAQLSRGLQLQRSLLETLPDDVDQLLLQTRLAGFFNSRDADVDRALTSLTPLLGQASPQAVAETLKTLKQLYWLVLDRVNHVPVSPGQVIYNANPPRVVQRTGRPRSAEVHALGNPQGKQILALEIRRPGTTYRAWDHVRFPPREVAIDKALGALNLQATQPAEFVAEPTPVGDGQGVMRSVEAESFVVDHLRPTPQIPVQQAVDGQPRTLHAISGSVTVHAADGTMIGRLDRGESALVPAPMAGFSVRTKGSSAEVVQVTIPV